MASSIMHDRGIFLLKEPSFQTRVCMALCPSQQEMDAYDLWLSSEREHRSIEELSYSDAPKLTIPYTDVAGIYERIFALHLGIPADRQTGRDGTIYSFSIAGHPGV